MVVATLFMFFLFPFGMASPISNTSNSSQTCSKDMLVTEIKKVFEESAPALKYLGHLPLYAGTSCEQIHELKPESKSGYYWIQGKSGASRVYCQMEEGPCGEGVWMRVADVNMTILSANCPHGLQKIMSPRQLCRKNLDRGCSSVKFSTFGVLFSKVCGQVIGYQHISPDAFAPYYHNQARTIDDLYVDGVSVTHSSNPRQHIWTFAAALHEAPTHTRDSCPCCYSRSRVPFEGILPEFIGNDYYCDTGSHGTVSSQYYFEDPLWDGAGCGRFSTCCDGDLKPWFIKKFNRTIESDLEFRLCCNEARSNEDILIEIINLFVQI